MAAREVGDHAYIATPHSGGVSHSHTQAPLPARVRSLVSQGMRMRASAIRLNGGLTMSRPARRSGDGECAPGSIGPTSISRRRMFGAPSAATPERNLASSA